MLLSSERISILSLVVMRIRNFVNSNTTTNTQVRLVEEYNENHIDFPLSLDRMRTFMERWNLMSIMWGFGASMNYENRKALSAFVCKSTTIEVPSFASDEESLLDFTVSLRDDAKWTKWSEQVPTVVLESRQVLSTNIVIPTIDTVRHRSALHAWLAEHKPLILCGPPGSGKTMTLTATLQSLPECVLVSLNFSSATTPDLILKTFTQYCEYVKTPQGLVLRPQQVGKWLVVFCDEINLPVEDKYVYITTSYHKKVTRTQHSNTTLEHNTRTQHSNTGTVRRS